MKEAESLYSVLALRIAVVLMFLHVAQFMGDRQERDVDPSCVAGQSLD